MERKTIFERDKNENLNLNQVTENFEKSISNPYDWLEQKILHYLPTFHQAIYEVFIDTAIEQIKQYNASWTDAVSIPAPKDKIWIYNKSSLISYCLFRPFIPRSQCPDKDTITERLF